MSTNFQKCVEDFTCEKCGTAVKGNGYTDHCPNCLTGKHVDNKPGDRAADCGALMTPTHTEYASDFTIHYKCTGCGKKSHVKAAPNDNEEKLFSLLSVKK
ncbi:RNHCP domain protein [uncultured archaeon]|nr:RNHCP domain protein [uncultured archaeon]